MKSMAGIAVISLGLILIIVGIFILVSKNNSQTEILANPLPEKQESKLIRSEKVKPGSEITNKDIVDKPSEKQQENQKQTAGIKQSVLQKKEVASNPTDESKRKGDDFEKFVVKKFNQKYFTLKEWTSDKFIDGVYAENTLGPDLVYQFSLGDISEGLAIECKWRRKLYDNFDVVTTQQIKNYRKFENEKNIPVFLVIGLGGEPSSPEQFYIIPLNRVNSTNLNRSFLSEFQQEINSNFYYDYKAKSLTSKSKDIAKQPV
jgi:hypothetical protein